jgi:TolB protein
MGYYCKVLLVVAGVSIVGGRLGAQDTTVRGVTVGITYDPSSRPGIAVLPVGGAYGDSVRAILQRDLDYSDRFVVASLDATDPGTLRAVGAAAGLNYPLFAQLGTVAVVQITPTATGLHVALHDVAKASVATVAEFPVPQPGNGLGREWRLALHGVADEIERWITGQRGIAQTRISFVRGAASGAREDPKEPATRIQIIDSDGVEEQSIPVVGSAFSPAWSPSGSMLVYSTWGQASRIVTYDIATGRSRALNATPGGSNLTPVFTRDGNAVVYSHAGEDGSDLFLSPLAGGDARRISVGRGSDNTSPTFSPDGRRIAFTSGRSGHPEIYIMDADGTNPELLTSFDFGDQNYRSDPDWSPDGRLIAFQSRFSGAFQVMTIDLRDKSTRQLTNEGANEQPSWAPDGRHLVFTSTRGGTKQLWVLDTESGRLRQLTHGGAARLPAWSPRLGAQPAS